MSAGRLLYFNGKGRAEGIRYVLAQAGITYKDEQFEFAKWQEIQKGKNVAFRLHYCNDEVL